MSFTCDLKAFCHTEVHNLYQRSRLVEYAKRGEFTEIQLEAYLKGLEFLFKVNADHIFQATQIYSSDPRLSEFFMEKWKEEKGHDSWARNDLKKISHKGKGSEVLPSLETLVHFLEATMKTSPYSYVAYLFYAEYLTAEIGPDWMKTITVALGISPKNITALSHHVQLDGDHAGEVLEFLEKIELNDLDQQRVYAFVKELTLKYDNFFNEIWEVEHGPKQNFGNVKKVPSAS